MSAVAVLKSSPLSPRHSTRAADAGHEEFSFRLKISDPSTQLFSPILLRRTTGGPEPIPDGLLVLQSSSSVATYYRNDLWAIRWRTSVIPSEPPHCLTRPLYSTLRPPTSPSGVLPLAISLPTAPSCRPPPTPLQHQHPATGMTKNIYTHSRLQHPFSCGSSSHLSLSFRAVLRQALPDLDETRESQQNRKRLDKNQHGLCGPVGLTLLMLLHQMHMRKHLDSLRLLDAYKPIPVVSVISLYPLATWRRLFLCNNARYTRRQSEASFIS